LGLTCLVPSFTTGCARGGGGLVVIMGLERERDRGLGFTCMVPNFTQGALGEVGGVPELEGCRGDRGWPVWFDSILGTRGERCTGFDLFGPQFRNRAF
jgi:hypothetical protein